MHVAQFDFVPRLQANAEPADANETSHAINGLLAALRMNGQVCGREWPIACTSTGYTATALIPEATALDVAHHNRYVRDALKQLDQVGIEEPHCTVVGKDIDGAELCACASQPAYLLYTYHLLLEPPLRCGSCFLPVPLYRIPPTQNEEYHDIICWQTD